MNKRILFVDTETGGLKPDKHSLLSIALAVWEKGEIIDSKEWYIKQDTYKITVQGMSINKIDLLDIYGTSKEPALVIGEIIDFLNCYFEENLPVTIAGHNVGFDVNFLKVFFQQNNVNFRQYFSHRVIDTASILKYLYLADVFSEDISSSDKAFEYFGIEIDKRHSALGDVIGTAQLFSKLIGII